MDKIYNIKYVDAYYAYTKDLEETHLPLHEAYGYVEKNGNNVVIIFIKKRGADSRRVMGNKDPIVKGLIVPDAALILAAKTSRIDTLKGIAMGASVAVVWRDVISVANMPIYECSIMYTKGVLHKVEKDHIVLRDPKTVRTSPAPVRNHPKDGGHPTYLMVPTSFITDIAIAK